MRRLQEAVDQFAGGSADAFARLIGFANGGNVRQVLSGKRPLRESIIHRVHEHELMQGWFDAVLSGISANDVRIAAAPPSAAWPLRRMTPAEWAEVDPYDWGAAEEAAMAKLRELAAERHAKSRKRLSNGD